MSIVLLDFLYLNKDALLILPILVSSISILDLKETISIISPEVAIKKVFSNFKKSSLEGGVLPI